MQELRAAIQNEDFDAILNECNILLFETEFELKGTAAGARTGRD